MTERIRINRIELGATLAGKPVIHLHAPGAQYSQYPVLYLFNPGLLIAIGIDPNSLNEDPLHVDLWAHFETSEKLNSKGNPYKDIVSLERIDALATTTSTDNTAVLAELRAIKALLLDLATGSSSTRRAERIQAVMQAGRSTGTAVDPQQTAEPKPEPELTETEARTEFYTLTGPAVIAGTDPLAINDLTALANGDGWNKALAGLRELLAN